MSKENWKLIDLGGVQIEYLPIRYWPKWRKTIVIAGVVIILMAFGLELLEFLLGGI